MNASARNDTIRPNLFIAGAPKCGTTSLFDYLVQYPGIVGGQFKEPHYFNDDQPEFRHATTLDQYLSFYARFRGGELRHVIDASTNYFYSTTAPTNILAFDKNAKVIVMLRNPADLVRSLHEHFLFKQSETEPDLAVAWNLGPIRERAPDFVKKHPYPGHLCYKSAGKLGVNYQRLAESIPGENLHTIFFEDLIQDPNEQLRRLLLFLQIEQSEEIEFEKRNRAKQIASPWLNRLLFYSTPIRFLKRTVKRIIPPQVIHRLDLYTLLSRQRQEKSQMSTSLRREILDHFREDIRLLSVQTDRNLDHWLES